LPLATLSTGTNNAFPELREATLVGIAAALFATGRVPDAVALLANKCLRVRGSGVDELALVDVVVTRQRHTGARAVWDGTQLSELYAAFAEPQSLGLSSIAGMLQPVPRSAAHGLHVSFGPGRVLWAPILPGALEPVSVAAVCQMLPGRALPLPRGAGTVALDGERELELDAGTRLSVELSTEGPRTVDVEAVLDHAARQGLMFGDADAAWPQFT